MERTELNDSQCGRRPWRFSIKTMMATFVCVGVVLSILARQRYEVLAETANIELNNVGFETVVLDDGSRGLRNVSKTYRELDVSSVPHIQYLRNVKKIFPGKCHFSKEVLDILEDLDIDVAASEGDY